MRPLVLADAEGLFWLNRDPEVIRYSGDLPFASVATAAVFLRTYDQYSRYGVGRLAVIDKRSGSFLGWCGLRYGPEDDTYDLGFRFFRRHWGQGLATETAYASLQWGFAQRGLLRVVGRAMAANTASIRVLEKVGMRFCGAIDFEGCPGVLYAAEQEAFLQKQRPHY